MLDDDVAIGRLYRKHARVAERAGDYRSSLAWCTRGLKLLAADNSRPALSTRAQLRLAASVSRFFQGRFESAISLARAGAADAERAGDQAALAQAHLQLEMACSELDLPEREEHARLALDLFESLDDPLGLANLHLNLGVSCYNEGRWDEALVHYGASIDAYQRIGDAIGAESARNNQAEILTDQGRYEEASGRLAEARRALKAANYRIGITVTSSGQATRRAPHRTPRRCRAVAGRGRSRVRRLELDEHGRRHEHPARRAAAVVGPGPGRARPRRRSRRRARPARRRRHPPGHPRAPAGVGARVGRRRDGCRRRAPTPRSTSHVPDACRTRSPSPSTRSTSCTARPARRVIRPEPPNAIGSSPRSASSPSRGPLTRQSRRRHVSEPRRNAAEIGRLLLLESSRATP